MTYKISYIDNGFCRINYTKKTKEATYYYCLQDEGENYGGVCFYVCADDDFEPSHQVDFKNPATWHEVELPTGVHDELITRVRNFILSKRESA